MQARSDALRGAGRWPDTDHLPHADRCAEAGYAATADDARADRLATGPGDFRTDRPARRILRFPAPAVLASAEYQHGGVGLTHSHATSRRHRYNAVALFVVT